MAEVKAKLSALRGKSPPAAKKGDGPQLSKQELALQRKRKKLAERKAKERSNAIERLNREEQSRISTVVRILFLGTPGSGLSTVFKQMKLIHQEKLDDADLAYYTRAVDITCLSSMLYLIHGCVMLGIPILGRDDEPPKQEKWLKLALDKVLTFDGHVVPELKALELKAFEHRRAKEDARWGKDRLRQLRQMEVRANYA